ncbi:MAG: ABC transporter permease subunit [Anaerolineae bacterium]|nr:ABC transporter permease subunit [Anaerolineae bacterium]
MFRNIFFKTLRDMRVSLFWWTLGMGLMSLYMMTFYPTIQESSAELQEYVDNLPDSMMALFGGQDTIDVSSIEGFLSMELFSFFYPFMTVVFAVMYGAGFIGREEEDGTLDVLLCTPIPRWRVILDKFAALVVFTLGVLAATYAGLIIGGVAVGIDDWDPGILLVGTLNMLPITLFFGALALCLTGIKGGRGLGLGVGFGFAAGSYLIFSLGELADIPRWLQQLSPWYYYRGIDVLYDGMQAGNVALLLGLTAVLVALGIWGFERRDVGV